LVVGSTGHLWASAPDVDRIGLFVPGTSQLWRWYSLPETGAGIAGLAYSWENGNHNLWYTAGDKGLVGTLVISSAGNLTEVRRHALSSPDSMPIGIAVDSNETAWIAEFAAVKIASWVPPYTRPSFVPLIQS
ncbi:MAG: hypothetical protein ACK2T3_03235, partial [Candidatus Promineifilaceae bacterium]